MMRGSITQTDPYRMALEMLPIWIEYLEQKEAELRLQLTRLGAEAGPRMPVGANSGKKGGMAEKAEWERANPEPAASQPGNLDTGLQAELVEPEPEPVEDDDRPDWLKD